MATQFSVNDNIAWKKRFFTIWIGQAISLLGSQLVGFAFVWYLTVRTGSASVLAMASMATMLPRIVLGPFIGPLIDRWDRKRTMLISDGLVALATIVMSVMFMLGEPPIWQIFLILIVRALAGTFHGPSMSASSSLMVPIEKMANIQGMNQMLNGGLSVFSAPLGALLLELVPIQSILLIDVVTAGIAMASLAFFVIPQPDRKVSLDLAGEGANYKAEVNAGFKYVWSWKGLTTLLILASFINFLINPAFTLLPLLIKEFFKGGAPELAKVEALFGGGAIVGSLLLSVWGGFKKKMHTAMLSLLLFGAVMASVSYIPADGLKWVLIAFAVVGGLLPFVNGSISAVMMAKVAPDMQGRVSTLTGTVSGIMMPIGLMIAGPVADLINIQFWFLVGGVSSMGIAIYGHFSKSLQEFENHEDFTLKASELEETQSNL